MTKGQRALVIAAAFFGYEEAIVNEFQRQGYETVYIDERPSNSGVARAIMRVRKELIGQRIDKYYRRKWLEIAGSTFDVVFVIKGEVIPRWFLERIRNANPDARFVFYSWDALNNAPNCLSILDCFDELFSFDSDDVALRPRFSYLPLFYTEEFKPLPSDNESQPRRFSTSFVGTLHTERYAYAKKIFHGRSATFGYFYVQARWYFAVVKYLTAEHKHVPWRDVSFQKLSRQQVSEIFRDSVAVVDIPRRGQSGLTMRTFEVLASGSVLATTNAAVTREPFFDPDRIVLLPNELDDAGLHDALSRLDSMKPPAGPPVGFETYSLESWVRSICGGQSRV